MSSVCSGNEYMASGSHKTTPCAAQQCISIFSGTSAGKSGLCLPIVTALFLFILPAQV